ncbi:MAG TPA: hypothetical protein ENH98_03985 [archaeon]|nr:hypothetical protein [archaeon]
MTKWFQNLFGRYEKYTSGQTVIEPYIYFKTFTNRLQPSLSKVFGETFGRDVISEYFAENMDGIYGCKNSKRIHIISHMKRIKRTHKLNLKMFLFGSSP